MPSRSKTGGGRGSNQYRSHGQSRVASRRGSVDPDVAVICRDMLIGSPHVLGISHDLMRYLASSNDPIVCKAMVKNPRVPPDILRDMYEQHADPELHRMILTHPKTRGVGWARKARKQMGLAGSFRA